MTGTKKMDSLVRFLFGHEQAVFTNGRFGFDVRPGALLLILIFLLAAAFIYFIYLRPRVRLPKRTTATLIALRATLLTVMILLLLPVAYFAVQTMRWWSRLIAASQRPEFKRAGT